MGVISFHAPRGPEDIWKAGGWAYSWLLKQAMAASPNAPLRYVFEQAEALGGLSLSNLEKSVAVRIRQILLDVAKRGAAGELPQVEVEGRILDEFSQRQFREAVAELVTLLT